MMSEPPITPTRSRPSIGRLSVLALVAIVALVVFGRELIVGDLPSEEEQLRQITNLETTVLPIVEELRVEYYMDQDGCTILTYERGDFVDGEPDCGGTTSTPVRFDSVARADLERLGAALQASETPVERTGGTFGGDGRGRTIWFSSSRGAPMGTVWYLEYDPDGTHSAGPQGMVTLDPVPGKADWWFACCAD
jgi:hypothetical protein